MMHYLPLAWFLFLAVMVTFGIWRMPPTKGLGPPPYKPRPPLQWTEHQAKHTTPQPPVVSDELIEAHLALRGVGYFWRPDVHMWMLYLRGMKDQPLHPADGYLVFVSREATLSGWLNGCDALRYHHLRRDSEGNIMSPYDIDPNTGQMNVP